MASTDRVLGAASHGDIGVRIAQMVHTPLTRTHPYHSHSHTCTHVSTHLAGAVTQTQSRGVSTTGEFLSWTSSWTCSSPPTSSSTSGAPGSTWVTCAHTHSIAHAHTCTHSYLLRIIHIAITNINIAKHASPSVRLTPSCPSFQTRSRPPSRASGTPARWRP